MATRESITARFPELASFTSDAQWAAVIAEAELTVGSGYGAGYRELLLTYYVGHLLSATRAGGSGILQSVTVGSVSRTYATPAASSSGGGAELGSTPYGREYLRLRRMLTPTVGVL